MDLSALRTTGFGSLAAMLLAAASPGWALTTQEVWAEMQRLSERSGIAQRAATETPGRKTLALEGVTLTSDREDTRLTTLIDTLTLRELGADRVEIVYPENLRVLIEDRSNTGMERAELLIDTSGLSTLVSGAPGAMTFAYSADEVDLSLVEFVSRDAVAVSEFAWTLTDLALTTQYTDDLAESEGSVARVSGVLAIASEEDDAELQMRFDATQPSFESSGNVTGLSPSADPSAIFAGDAPYRFESQHDGINLILGSQFDGLAGVALLALGSGGSAIAARDGQVSISSQAEDVKAQTILPNLPAPLDAAAATLAFNLSAPAAPGDGPRPLALGVSIAELTLNEEVWNQFDPAGLLPRSPATLELDLTGAARVTEDFLSPRITETPGLHLDSLVINRLLLEAAGARITAEGSFAVDLSRPGTLPGLPALNGRLGLATTGLNGLLDSLAQLGILQPSDVMGARMVIAMLTTPSNAPDSLTAEIELKPDGGLVANGMRLR